MSFVELPVGKQAIVNSSGAAISLDSTTNVLSTIEYEHHEVHAGSSFHCFMNK